MCFLKQERPNMNDLKDKKTLVVKEKFKRIYKIFWHFYSFFNCLFLADASANYLFTCFLFLVKNLNTPSWRYILHNMYFK